MKINCCQCDKTAAFSGAEVKADMVFGFSVFGVNMSENQYYYICADCKDKIKPLKKFNPDIEIEL